ncbi:Fur family transcriptional regulator [Nitrosospira briensis]|uniref:Ferric uptake regulation protein n=1 Tax=Nitrosospira briensis TaxID=35799 RepID=A0A1I5E664_9PROT|nr:transcriptional repressor [Nitrosospira briensis]SFO07004.1 Fur family transcriptional regulator, ferric uptake regulator [Nitrosospira briensis]SFO25682.1 Fur family transcriptional regulator, ferric uptake regulator [Nitrosospira briensis]
MKRNTRQRDAILGAISDARRPLSTQEILTEAQVVVPTLSIATVYRNLKDLTAEGWVLPVKLPGEADRYEVTKLGEHYHFKCSSCSKVFDIHETIKNKELPVPADFVVESYDLILYGRCKDCTPKSRNSGPGASKHT